jgi:predicted nucleic acid-binding protein
MDAILLDTNVLVYAHDRGEFEKQGRAILLLEQLRSAGVGRLCVQVLAEFFWATTRGKAPLLTVEQAHQQVVDLTQVWRVFDLTTQIVLEAVRGVRDHQLSYWDAQIWAAAKLNQVNLVLSEDFQSNRVIEGVRFVNPLDPSFAIEELLSQ